MNGKRDGQAGPLRDAITAYLKSRGLMKSSRESLVPVVWHEVVGEWYAKHTQVLRVERGVLTVRCDSPARAQQLQLDSPKIIETLRARVGSGVVREIRPSSGGISSERSSSLLEETGVPAGPSKGELQGSELTAAEQQWIAETVAGIEDEALRTRVAAVLCSEAKASRWKAEHGYVPCKGCGALIRPGRARCMTCDPGRIPMQGSPDVFVDKWKGDDWA